MLDFIGNAFTSATTAWAIAYVTQALGYEDIGAWFILPALLFSAVAFSALIVGAMVWVARHVRIVVV